MQVLNKAYVVVDTEAERVKDFNHAIITRPYSSITVPRKVCAEKNRMEKKIRYVVEEIPIIRGIRHVFVSEGPGWKPKNITEEAGDLL